MNFHRCLRKIQATAVVGVLLAAAFQSAAYMPLDKVEKGQAKTYEDYQKQWVDALPEPSSDEVVTLSLDQISSSEKTEYVGELSGYSGSVLKVQEGGYVEWAFTLPDSRAYGVELTCCQVNGRGSDTEFQLLINGTKPFDTASFEVRRIYKDEVNGKYFEQDAAGNDMVPSAKECPMWQTVFLKDPLGYTLTPYVFAFAQGKNTLRMDFSREGLAIRYVRLTPLPTIPTYENAAVAYQAAGYQKATADPILIQGEHTSYKNNKSIVPRADRTSPTTMPSKGSRTSLNYIGGNNWKSQGDSASWSFVAEQTGLYKIVLKSRQKYNKDVFATRRLLIDGAVPFRETEALEFPYSADWQNYTIGGEESPYLFYLEKGVHTLTLEVSLGALGNIIEQVEKALTELNLVYRDILMLTGSSPDIYRDYNFDTEIPQALESMQKQAAALSAASREMVALAGSRGTNTSILDRISAQLKDLHENPDTIAARFGTFKDNLGSLGTWLLTVNEQALDLDYILVAAPDYQPPRADATFLQKAWHEIKSFFYSFTTDYNVANESNETKETIEVWLATGRDQVQILKKMIGADFTKTHKIGVDLKLVQGGVLLPSTVAGKNPDVYLQASQGEAINFAMRGAVVNLKQFDGYEDVAKRFHSSAMVPFLYEDGAYALPETQQYFMMFYRRDILQQLHLEIPETWDEIDEILPVLQKSNMEFAMPVSTTALAEQGIPSFYMFLLQNGGALYNPKQTATQLDSEEAITAFKQWTGFYVNHKLQQTYDAANRFRRGETPLLIADYSLYNTLQVFAPEIRDQWAFTQIPGMRQADGSINRACSSSGTCSMMLAANDQKEASWKFLDWWTAAGTQTNYGVELETAMGASARYPTANLEAVSSLPWSGERYALLLKQREEVQGIPQIPGSYFLPRHLNNAFRGVVISGQEPRETILDYTEIINAEISKKRKEFASSTEG